MTTGGWFQRGNRARTLRDLVRVGVAAGAAGLVVAVVVAPVTSNVGVLLSDTTKSDTVITAPLDTSVHPRDIKVRLRPPPPDSTPDATSGLVALDVLDGVIESPPTDDGAADASRVAPDVRLRVLPAPVAFHPAELLGLPPGPPTPAIPTVEVEDPMPPAAVVVPPTPKKGPPPALTTTSAPRKSVPLKPGKPAKPAKSGKGHENNNKPGDRGAPDWANGHAPRDNDDARSDAGDDRGSAPAENSRDEKKNPKAGGPKEGKSEKAGNAQSSSPGNSDMKAKAKKSDEAEPTAEYSADEVEPTG